MVFLTIHNHTDGCSQSRRKYPQRAQCVRRNLLRDRRARAGRRHQSGRTEVQRGGRGRHRLRRRRLSCRRIKGHSLLPPRRVRRALSASDCHSHHAQRRGIHCESYIVHTHIACPIGSLAAARSELATRTKRATRSPYPPQSFLPQASSWMRS